MSEERRGRRGRALIGIGVGIGLMVTTTPASVTAGVITPDQLPGCGYRPASASIGPEVGWSVRMNDDGVVSGHRLSVGDGETRLRLGRRAFATVAGDGRVLLGERRAGRTHLSMIDQGTGCRVWQRHVAGLAFPAPPDGSQAHIPLRIVDPATRSTAYGIRVDPENGASSAMVDGECPGDCESDDEAAIAALLPAGADRPVPPFAGGPWPRDKRLPFGWRAGAVPPDWAKIPLKAAARDAVDTSKARSPRFSFSKDATNDVRYTSDFPSFCRLGIGCAARILSSGWWTTWLRPHGTEFAWGTLRWCQRQDHASCFDLRRVMLHELGHISGLNHPETQGTRLSASKTVMSAITPTKRSAGGNRHRYGSCDVATLQELYGVPSRSTHVSRCNDVATTVRLWADADVVERGDSVRFKAELRIADREAYGRLAGDLLDGRVVKLRHRRAGSDGPWSSAVMAPKAKAGRYEVTLEPGVTREYRAVFREPGDEGLRFSRSQIKKVKVRAS